MSNMGNKQADGFRQVEEQCRELAQRASWVIEALPRPRNGAVETEDKLRKTCQYVESALAELRDVVHSVRGLEAALLAAQAETAERDEAAVSAAAKVQDAQEKIAAAEKMAAAAEASIKTHGELNRVLEAERAGVQASMTQLNTMLEATRKEANALEKERSDLDKSVKEAREMEKAAESVERQRAQAEEDVGRLKGLQNDLVDEWQRLRADRRRLERDVADYKAATEYNQLRSDVTKELREEEARVGRRDETIARLNEDIRVGERSILKLKSDYNAEVSKVKERDRVIAEMELEQETTVAAELQARLSQAGVKVDAAQKKAASEYQGLVRKLDEMKVSQHKTLESFHADTEGIKEAMVSATRNMVEGTTASYNLKTDLSPNMRAVKDSIQQIGDMKRQLQNMDEMYSARQRDEAARARKHMVMLIHEIDSQTREQHQQELTEMGQLHEARLTELLTTKEDELARARQQYEKDINAAQKEATDLQLVVNQLRQQPGRDQAPPASPDRRRQKPRADDSQPRPQAPPPSVPRGPGAMETHMARWQAALQSASEFWGSFEPRLIDPSGDLTYEMLLHQLRKAARDEAARSRFMAFLQSDATGWHCVERVVDPGSESAVLSEEGECTLKRHRKAGECLRMKRVGGRGVDFQYTRNK